MRRIALVLALSVGGCSTVLGLDTFKDGPASGGAAGTGALGGTGGTASGGAAGSGAAPTGGAAGSGGMAGAPSGGGTAGTGGAAGSGGAPSGGGGTGGTGGAPTFKCTVAAGSGQDLIPSAALGDAYGLVAIADEGHSTAHVLIGQNWPNTPPSSHYNHEIVGVVSTHGSLQKQTGIAIFTPLRIGVSNGIVGSHTVLYGISESGKAQGVEVSLDSSGLYSPPTTNQAIVNDIFDPSTQCTGVGQYPQLDGFATSLSPSSFSFSSVHFVASCYSYEAGAHRRSYLGEGAGTAYQIVELSNADSSLIPQGYDFDFGTSASLVWQKDSTFRIGTNASQLSNPPLTVAKPATCTGPAIAVGLMPRKGGANAFFTCNTAGPDLFYYAKLVEPYPSGFPAATPTSLPTTLPAPLGMSRASITANRRVIAARTQQDGQQHYHVRLIVTDASGDIQWDGGVFTENSEIQEVAAAQLDATNVIVAWRTIGGPVRAAEVTCQ